MSIRNLRPEYDTDAHRLYFVASDGEQFDLTSDLGTDGVNALISAALTTGLGSSGNITASIRAAITAELGDGGAIKAVINAAIAAIPSGG